MDITILPEQLMRINPIKLKSWVNHGFISKNSSKNHVDDFLKKHYAVKAKPFVKWVGGKRQLLKQFQNLFPKSFNPLTNTYFELFIGGGAVFFNLQPYNAVISDINIELITTYQTIKDNVENLIIDLKKHKYEKEYFLEIRAKHPKDLKPLDIASRFIFLNRTCFNGMYRVNKKVGLMFHLEDIQILKFAMRII